MIFKPSDSDIKALAFSCLLSSGPVVYIFYNYETEGFESRLHKPELKSFIIHEYHPGRDRFTKIDKLSDLISTKIDEFISNTRESKINSILE